MNFASPPMIFLLLRGLAGRPRLYC